MIQKKIISWHGTFNSQTTQINDDIDNEDNADDADDDEAMMIVTKHALVDLYGGSGSAHHVAASHWHHEVADHVPEDSLVLDDGVHWQMRVPTVRNHKIVVITLVQVSLKKSLEIRQALAWKTIWVNLN